ncbi:TPA: hypothetical protein ACOEXB_003937 [Yersinia enterocolitica]
MKISASNHMNIAKAFNQSKERVHFSDLSTLKNAMTSIKNDSKTIGILPSSNPIGELKGFKAELKKMQTTLEGQGSNKLEAKSQKISDLMTQVNNLLKKEGVIESHHSKPQDLGRAGQERDVKKADLQKSHANHSPGFGLNSTTKSHLQFDN